jgi:Outer membrane protein beta-barrel domain
MKILRAGIGFGLLMALSAPAQAQKFGVMGGGNWEALADVDASLSASVQTSAGFHIGPFMEIGTPIVSVRPALLYSNATSLAAGFSGIVASVSSYRISNLILPVDVKLNAIPVLYFMAGPELQYNLSSGAPEELNDSFNKLTFHGSAGLGFAFGPVFLEGRYVFGLSSITKSEYTILGQTVTADAQTANAVRASIGVSF